MVVALMGYFVYKSPLLKVLAGEQTGLSPDSGSSSRIKDTYDALFTANLGYETGGVWGDWGAYWNRIRSSALSAVNYEAQSLEGYDDYKYSNAYGAGEGGDEESVWDNTAVNVYRDSRTGLYWSVTQGQFTNNFNVNHALCPFFAENPRGSSYDGLDADCGNAINACAPLALEANTGDGNATNWYLPSQKELMTAYINGIYNQTSPAFVSTSNFWSASEISTTTSYAWYVDLSDGPTYFTNKTTSYDVRCVRRD